MRGLAPGLAALVVTVCGAVEVNAARLSLGFLHEARTDGARVTLALEITPGRRLNHYEVTVLWNPSVATLVEVRPGGAAPFGEAVDAIAGTGSVTLSGDRAVFPSRRPRTAELAQLDFEIHGLPDDFTSFTIGSAVLLDRSGRALRARTVPAGVLLDMVAPQGAGAPLAPEPSTMAPRAGDLEKAWEAAKKSFDGARKTEQWRTLVNAIEKLRKEYDAATDDATRKEVAKKISQPLQDLAKIVDPFVRTALADLVAGNADLEALIEQMKDFKITVSAFLAASVYGVTDNDKKVITLNLKALSNAEDFFTTAFHEGVHATTGKVHSKRDRGFYAEELWVEDQENRLREGVGLHASARQESQEWNYTLQWKAENRLVEKSTEKNAYVVTDAGKRIADCYFAHLAGNGWKWDGKQPSDVFGVIYYDQIRWKLDKAEHKTDFDETFTVVTVTDTKPIGEEVFAATDPCKE